MPHYYFHLFDDLDVPDEEGAELPGLDAAKAFAAKSIRSMVAAQVMTEARLSLAHRIDIEDALGRVLAQVRFSDVVKIEE